jgi:hypothetical protein
MIYKNTRLFFLAILIVLSACVNTPVKQAEKIVRPTSPFRSLQELMVKEKVTDARYQQVIGHDFFWVNLPLRYQLQHYQELSDLQTKRHFVIDILQEAVIVGEEAMGLYLSRLPLRQLNQFTMEHKELSGDDGDLFKTYQQYALQAEAAEAKRIRNISTVDELDQYWDSFIGNIEESIMSKDRLKRQLETFLEVPFIKAWIAYHEATDFRGAITPDFKYLEIYEPLLNNTSRPDSVTSKDWALLQHFAPIVVHEINPSAVYAIENDRLGKVYLTGNNYDNIVPHVDTTQPAVYAYVDQKMMQGVNVKQLIYTFWHPSHPQLSKLDPEAGPFDGWTIRVTLDQNNQPLDFESVSNCGCYYKNFPTDRLEELAADAFPEKLKDKHFYVENSVNKKYDAVIPELVTDVDSEQANNIVFYFSAGHHQLITIRSKQHAELLDNTSERRSYELYHYKELENLSFNNRYASLFGTDGLVRGAHRPECTLLKPSGLYHAGHPRQRETQMIYFDDTILDDPKLLEIYLRLPPNVFGQQM